MNADSEQSMLSIGKLMDIPKKKTFAYPFPTLSLPIHVSVQIFSYPCTCRHMHNVWASLSPVRLHT